MLRLAIVLIAVLLLAPNAQAQKPTVEAPIVSDYWNIPETLEGFIAASQAAVIAKIIAVDDSSINRKARTVYQARVWKTLKEHQNLGQHLEVCRAIGKEEMPDKIVRYYEPNLPAFSPGSEYLLFLRWDDRTDCFWPMFGPPSVGVFDQNGVFRSFNKHPVLQSLNGLSRDAVVGRAAAGRTP